MANGETFKTVMRGYAKDEVVAYIADLNANIKSLTEESDRKEAQIARLTEEIEALKAEPSEPSEEQAASLRAEIEEELRASLQEEIEEKVRAEYEKKAAEKEGESVAELERKVKEYDEYRASLADLMIEARKNADEVVRKAREEADAIRRKTQLELADFVSEFGVLKQNIDLTKQDIQKNLDEAAAALSVFDQRLSVIQHDIDAATQAFHLEGGSDSDWA